MENEATYRAVHGSPKTDAASDLPSAAGSGADDILIKAEIIRDYGWKAKELMRCIELFEEKTGWSIDIDEAIDCFGYRSNAGRLQRFMEYMEGFRDGISFQNNESIHEMKGAKNERA